MKTMTTYGSDGPSQTGGEAQTLSPITYVFIGVFAAAVSVAAALMTEQDYPGLFDECCAPVALEAGAEFASKQVPPAQ